MSRTIDSPNDFQSFQDDPSPTRQVQEALRGKTVCPFCGAVAESGDGACGKCTMENSPLTRQATKARLGPWYVLQTRNPSAPGMKYSVLLSLVKKGQITPKSIVRGPTTNQFWRFAAKVRGLSREFGICWGCGGEIESNAATCPACQRTQEPPGNPDLLIDSRQPLSQVLPVRREIKPSFKEQAGREAVAQETMQPQRQRVHLPGPQREPNLDELAQQEMADQRMMIQGRRLPSQQPMLPQGDMQVRPAVYRDFEPRQPLGKVLLLLVLMAAFTVAGWLYVDQASRVKFFAWAQTTWADITGDAETPVARVPVAGGPEREKIVVDGAPKAAPAPTPQVTEPATPVRPAEPERLAQVVPAPVPPRVQESAPAPAPVAPRVEETRPAPAPPAPVTPRTEEPKAAPLPVPPPAPEVKPPQVDISVGSAPVSRQPDPRVEIRTPAAPPRDATGSAEVAVTNPDEQIALSRKLWRQAIDAEARGDWAEAVRLYEQIKRLPAAAWPGGIDINLNHARGRAQ